MVMRSLFSKFTQICGFTWAIILAGSISAQESPFIGGNLNEVMNSLVFTAEHTVFQTYTNPKNINSLVIEKQSDNVFWLGSSAGLIRLDVISGKQEIFTDQLPDVATRVVCQSADNTIWIGTAGWLVRFNYGHREWTVFNVDNSELPNNRINSILQSADGALWIGTEEGLARFDFEQDRWTVFSFLYQYHVRALVQASDEAIWVGATGTSPFTGGLYRLDFETNEWTLYNYENSGVDVRFVTTIMQAADDVIWIGTSNGLFRFDYKNNQWEEYSAWKGNTSLVGVSSILQTALSG